MIIQCENCKSRFQIEERLLTPEGSKVRCSVCRNVFTVYPPSRAPEEMEPAKIETPPDTAAAPPEFPRKAQEEDIDFDNLFERAYVNEEGRPPEEDEDEEEVPEDKGEPAEKWETPAPEKRGPARPARRHRGHPWLVLLIILLLLAAGAAAVWFFAPQYLSSALSLLDLAGPKPEDTGAKQLTLEDVSGKFVDSSTAGRLFVIQGIVVNNYPTKKSFMLVRGSLLNEQGQAVKSLEAYAGNPFSEDELKTLSVAEMDKAMQNRDGVGRNNFNVEPNGKVPFTIVFHDLPQNLSEFTVEPIQSSPGM